MITLHCGQYSLGLMPDFGGSVAFWRDGLGDIFRPTSPAAVEGGDMFGAAHFPLVPFSNRVSSSRFRWGAKEISIANTLRLGAHCLHGFGWQRSWSLARHSEAEASLTLHFDEPESWPWAFAAEQNFALGENGLRWSMELENLSDSVMPAGMGFHPYFMRGDAQLAFDASHIWLSDSDDLPTHKEELSATNNFRSLRALDETMLDNCYEGWNGTAEIFWASLGRRLMLKSEADFAVVYTPDDADFFCFEAANHVNNAVNMEDQGAIMPSLEPGEKNRIQVEMIVER